MASKITAIIVPYPLRSAAGFSMIRKYVKNWHSILMVHVGLKDQTTVKFRDGTVTSLSKSDYHEFREHLYEKYLQDHGFRYSRDMKNRKVISLPDGFREILPEPPDDYSWHYDEIYIVKAYGQPDLKGRVVIDVGAAIGDTPLYFYGLGAEKVYAFDPNKARAELARENISLNGLEDHIIFYERPATAEAIHDIIMSIPDDRLFFLKLDCEGCEYELLRDFLSKNSQGRIDEIIMEYHPKIGHYKLEALLDYLEKAGFDKPFVNSNIIHAKRNVVSLNRTP